jgi:hypothetical protein
MAQRVAEPLFKIAISIVGGQQGGFVLPQTESVNVDVAFKSSAL